MKHIVFVLSLWMAFACSKSDTLPPSSELVGTWRLISYCKPVSDSTCTVVNVPNNKAVFVSFDKDGGFHETYENTKPVDYGFLGCGSGTYSIEGDQVRIIALCMSSTSGKLMPLASISSNRLVLKPFGPGEYVFVR